MKKGKHSKKLSKRVSKRVSKRQYSKKRDIKLMPDKVDNTVHLDITDQSLIDFKKSKSITVVSKLSDLKTSKIGELYDVEPIHDNMHRLCNLKIHAKSQKHIPIPKNISRSLCDCLFEKNKTLSIAELEERVSKREDTPASECIQILDNYIRKHGNSHSRTTSKSSKSTKSTI